MEFATGALGTLLPKLGRLLHDEYKLQVGTKKDIEYLSRELESMRAALRDVGEVPPEDLSEVVRIWARDVRELSYDMEDIVDTMVRVEGSPSDAPSNRSVKRFIKKMTKKFTKATSRHEIAHEMKDIKERVKEVAERRDRCKVDAIIPSKTSIVDPRIVALYTKATDLVGIDEPKQEVITRLTKQGDGTPADQQKRIVSIAGFGGLGKTTLAKAVYDELKGQFQCTAFVTVSRNPDTKKLLMNMLHDLDGNMPSSMLDEQHLIDMLRKSLQNRRYLIVIDDIWDIKSWKIIACALIENNMRSKIITTTRIIRVAEQVGGCYKLKPLSDEISRILFYGRIFGSEDKCPRKFLEVSKKILKKCGGVPLAIITTSSLLANKSGNINEWNDVCDSIGSGLGSNSEMDNMRKILCLSYNDLPSHLKTCLLYLSMFPEDSKIGEDRLIWRWIAEDFVQHEQGDQSLFELGQSYFNELLNRSLIQPEYMYEDGIPIPNACRVHDVVLDLLCSFSREECFVTTVLAEGKQSTTPYLGSKVRRLSLLVNNTSWPSMSMTKLRSLTIFCSDILSPDKTNLMPSLSCYHLLRVLDLEGFYLGKFPDLRFVGSLFHLRYLGLYETRYGGELPAEIGNLQFLQTLELTISCITELPWSVVGLRQLMCLRVDSSTKLPNGLSKLTSLEVLGTVTVESTSMADAIGHLTRLRELHVQLKKEDGQYDERMCKRLVESLGKLHKIKRLDINEDWYHGVSPDLNGTMELLGHLRRLIIKRAMVMPTWINPTCVPVLCHLVLCLDRVRSEDIHVLGALPALRSLKLEEGLGMEIGGGAEAPERPVVGRPGAFPCLTSCVFLGCTRIVPSMFPPGAMPRLEKFQFGMDLEDCSSNGSNDELAVDNLALGHLPSLLSVQVWLHNKRKASEDMRLRAREKLMQEVDSHPNHPYLDLWF